MAKSFGGDNVRMHERIFRLCAPFSPVQPLVLLVCAAPPSAVKFTMTQQCTYALLLERPKVTKIRLPALQHAAHAHEQHLNAVQAVRCAPKQARPHSGTRHTIAVTDSEDEGHAEMSDGTFVGEGRSQK